MKHAKLPQKTLAPTPHSPPAHLTCLSHQMCVNIPGIATEWQLLERASFQAWYKA